MRIAGNAVFVIPPLPSTGATGTPMRFVRLHAPVGIFAWVFPFRLMPGDERAHARRERGA